MPKFNVSAFDAIKPRILEYRETRARIVALEEKQDEIIRDLFPNSDRDLTTIEQLAVDTACCDTQREIEELSGKATQMRTDICKEIQAQFKTMFRNANIAGNRDLTDALTTTRFMMPERLMLWVEWGIVGGVPSMDDALHAELVYNDSYLRKGAA